MKTAFTRRLYKGYRSLLRNPQSRWLVVLGTLLYLVSPLDIIPDVPIVGWIDDGLIATLLVTELSQLVTESLKRDRVRASSGQAPSQAPEVQTVPSTAATVVDVEAVSVA